MKKDEKVVEENTSRETVVGVEKRASKKTINKRIKKKKKLTQADIKKYSMSELDHVISKIKANEVKYTVLSVIFILIVFFIIAYIVFSSVQEHTNHNVLKHGSLYIEFKGNENGLGDIVDLVNVPTYSDGQLVIDTYEVTITNDSLDEKKYQIMIEDDLDMIEIDKCSDIFLDRKYLRYSVNDGNDKELNVDDQNSIVFGTLSGKKSVTYKIKVWVSDTYLEKPHYHGKIVVKQVNEKDQKVVS